MTNVKNITRIISKHTTTKPIKKNKPVDWTTPNEERHNQIKRSWITNKK